MDLEILRKRLLYKSANRGWKETDLLLGEFAKLNLSKMDKNKLEAFDALLDEPDGEIFNWITKKVEVPAKHNNAVMDMLLDFQFKIL